MPSEIAEIGSDERDVAPGRHDGVALRVRFDRLGEHSFRTEAEPVEHDERHEGGAGEQKARLDDLHPGGRFHPAKGDIDNHEHTYDHYGVEIIQSEQQLDQLPCTDHLRDQIERNDDQCTGRRQDAIGVWSRRNEATSAKVKLPRLRKRSAIRNSTTGQPTRNPIE